MDQIEYSVLIRNDSWENLKIFLRVDDGTFQEVITVNSGSSRELVSYVVNTKYEFEASRQHNLLISDTVEVQSNNNDITWRIH